MLSYSRLCTADQEIVFMIRDRIFGGNSVAKQCTENCVIVAIEAEQIVQSVSDTCPFSM